MNFLLETTKDGKSPGREAGDSTKMIGGAIIYSAALLVLGLAWAAFWFCGIK